MFTLFAAALLAVGAASSSPALFWSPQDVNAISKISSASVFTWESLEEVVSGVCGTGAAAAPEALLLFTFDEFSTSDFVKEVHPFSETTSGGSMSAVHAALLSSASSAVVPYASLAGNSFLKRLSVFSGQTGLPFTSHSSYESLIQSLPSEALLVNGRCDVVLVSLHKTFTAADDAAISKVIDEVATTSGSYAVGIVGQSSLPSDGLTHRTERMLLNGKKINIYMSPDIFSGLLVGLLFLVTALIGACCLHSIQTPTKFNAEPLPLGKEF